MAVFLDAFDVERGRLLKALEQLESVWARFSERPGLDVDSSALSDSLITGELVLVRHELEATAFNVGLFGLIKRGKSTLLNGLIGREVSAMHVTPETGVPVHVGYGETPGAIVHFADGHSEHVAVEDATQYTSQKANPANQKGVTYVEQSVPVSFLRNGIRIVDTPGLDDAEADNVYTQRTMQELDSVDAGIVLFLSPPTVGSTEMSFLEQVVSRDLKKTFLVCNMYPQHFHDPESRGHVLEYVGRRIVEATRRAGRGGEVRVYPVCAIEAWQARLDDDIDMWRRSGAERLMRDLEGYLSGGAGMQVLYDAADRIVMAAEAAKSEVRVRAELLADPEQLAAARTRVDQQVRDLETQFDAAVDEALRGVDALRARIRASLLQPFGRARRAVPQLQHPSDAEQFSRRFRREVEVAAEAAAREFATGFDGMVQRVRTVLEERFHAVMRDLAPNAPQPKLGRTALLLNPNTLEDANGAERRARQTTRTGALAGGLAGGGMALLAANALLGPIGLIGGALVGWKLSSLASSGASMGRTREALLERLDDVADELVGEFDRDVAKAVEAIRAAVERRRRAFAADLYQQFDIVSALAADRTRLEAEKRDVLRFLDAFDACAARALNAVDLPAPIHDDTPAVVSEDASQATDAAAEVAHTR